MKKFTATRNACKLCAPLGAAVVFCGISGGVPFLHGSQGCATYIRRYLISHFREPVDIACSSFSEESVVFGGRQILKLGLQNVCRQYQPRLIGIATTCLAETIGEDVGLALRELKDIPDGVKLVFVATPSYKGTHTEGFRAAVKAVIEALALPGRPSRQVNVLPGFLSSEDLRHLKEILGDYGLPGAVIPDYSEKLDGGIWDAYHKIPEGGTALEQIIGSGGALATIEFTRTAAEEETAGRLLRERFGVPFFQLGIPVGIKETDAFFGALGEITGLALPQKYKLQRARLIDSYVDGHKYLFGKKAAVFGDEDLVAALAAFLTETGIIPVICASGGKSGNLKKAVSQVAPEFFERLVILDGADFAAIGEAAEKSRPDFVIGSSKGYALSQKLGVPLIRTGFPIHDRIGGQRCLQIGYAGTQRLFDLVVNALLARVQADSAVGYSYL